MPELPVQLSIVIPLYNEADRFNSFFPKLEKWHNQQHKWEWIFVNDGSKDKTEAMVQKKIQSYPRMRVISYNDNKGKGFAIRSGILNAKQDFILFTDIDLSTPLNELETMYPFIIKGADIVIGTRKVQGAQILEHQPKLREWLGRRFTQLTNAILGLDISDYTCGFKLLKKNVARSLFKKQRILRWGFDAELLFLAHHFDYRVVEVPVVWKNDARTKVNLGRDILNSLWELVLIRWNFSRGKY